MFTGIIQGLGHIIAINDDQHGTEWTIDVPLTGVNLGASIAVNGVCSTVKSYQDQVHQIVVDYLPETLKKTTFSQMKVGDQLNIEPSLKYGDEMGGHMITGHIDTVGFVKHIENQGEFHRLVLGYSSQFARYVIPKGSIAIDGISLTVVMDDDRALDFFEVHIIPHTWKHTNLQYLSIGDHVNLEFDQVGKYEVRREQVGLN